MLHYSASIRCPQDPKLGPLRQGFRRSSRNSPPTHSILAIFSNRPGRYPIESEGDDSLAIFSSISSPNPIMTTPDELAKSFLQLLYEDDLNPNHDPALAETFIAKC